MSALIRLRDIFWGYRFFRKRGLTRRDAWSAGRRLATDI